MSTDQWRPDGFLTRSPPVRRALRPKIFNLKKTDPTVQKPAEPGRSMSNEFGDPSGGEIKQLRPDKQGRRAGASRVQSDIGIRFPAAAIRPRWGQGWFPMNSSQWSPFSVNALRIGCSRCLWRRSFDQLLGLQHVGAEFWLAPARISVFPRRLFPCWRLPRAFFQSSASLVCERAAVSRPWPLFLCG